MIYYEILYLLFALFAIRSTQLLFKRRLVTVLGINLNDPSFDSGSESAEHIPTLNSAKDALEIGSDGAGGVGAQLMSSIRGLSGVTMADQWRLTSSFTGNADPISSNLSQVDSDGFDNIGSSMSLSSGLFTFPTTGYYLINAIGSFEFSGSRRLIQIIINTSTDGNNYNLASVGSTSINQVSTETTRSMAKSSFLFSVTDTATHKVSFSVAVGGTNVSTLGASTLNSTYFTFIRLGDL